MNGLPLDINSPPLASTSTTFHPILNNPVIIIYEHRTAQPQYTEVPNMETLLDKKQVAELLRISVKTLDVWISKQQAPKTFRIGRLVRFRKSDVESFVESLTEGK
jgi:excisionase family DNA binding protein